MIGLVDGNNFFVSCERVFNRRLLGKRVAVLSNNDGCCVAMSPEFKALGIPRGTPYFQLREREARDGLIFLSSNYELYGDMSRRIIAVLREKAVEVEQYSIDEAFILPPPQQNLLDYGLRLRETILRWTGIPCGIGFAPTKTLAKIANHAAKKLPCGVLVLEDDPSERLAKLPVGEVWGVGRKLVMKLRLRGISTALDLRNAASDVLRSIGGITLERTALELRGVSCKSERDYEADADSISCSRSFGKAISDRDSLVESIASFLSKAAEKLRKCRKFACGCNVYAQRTDLTFDARTVIFPAPTDATHEMLSAVRPVVEALWTAGVSYRKSGMVFFGLEKPGSHVQGDLFDDTPQSVPSRLYSVVDELNACLGSNTVFSAAEGIERKWKMNRARLSPRATTCWSELPIAHAGKGAS